MVKSTFSLRRGGDQGEDHGQHELHGDEIAHEPGDWQVASLVAGCRGAESVADAKICRPKDATVADPRPTDATHRANASGERGADAIGTMYTCTVTVETFATIRKSLRHA